MDESKKLIWITELCRAQIELELFFPSKDRKELLEMYVRQLTRNLKRHRA